MYIFLGKMGEKPQMSNVGELTTATKCIHLLKF